MNGDDFQHSDAHSQRLDASVREFKERGELSETQEPIADAFATAKRRLERNSMPQYARVLYGPALGTSSSGTSPCLKNSYGGRITSMLML